jgi:hypothetical protein
MIDAPAKMAGSIGDTSNRRLFIVRVSHADAIKPVATRYTGTLACRFGSQVIMLLS